MICTIAYFRSPDPHGPFVEPQSYHWPPVRPNLTKRPRRLQPRPSRAISPRLSLHRGVFANRRDTIHHPGAFSALTRAQLSDSVVAAWHYLSAHTTSSTISSAAADQRQRKSPSQESLVTRQVWASGRILKARRVKRCARKPINPLYIRPQTS